jgi:two-component system, OmpR family, phosphate regulon sensor histidine kinase PhoR
MFKKNQTPGQLALGAAFTSALLVTLLIFLLERVQLLSISLTGLAIVFISILLIDFFANFVFVQFYIFRKIKLIYKIIHHRKTSTDFKAGEIDMSKDILSDIGQEVDEWAERYGREIENLEHMAQYRRQFIGDVSHELKTPIFNIQGFIHTLLDGAINDPEVNITFLQRAARNVERLQTIVEDLETISKMEAGHSMLDIQEFDLHELTAEVFSDLEARAIERQVKLQFKDGADQHFRVQADRDSVRQVLINLIHNSIKYGNNGGIVKVSFYDMESYILVEVSDNGIGIAPEHIPHLFDRFYRVDKHRSRDAGGTGLGLAIVKHIIESHRQTINVRSTPNQGTTFGFTLQKM